MSSIVSTGSPLITRLCVSSFSIDPVEYIKCVMRLPVSKKGKKKKYTDLKLQFNLIKFVRLQPVWSVYDMPTVFVSVNWYFFLFFDLMIHRTLGKTPVVSKRLRLTFIRYFGWRIKNTRKLQRKNVFNAQFFHQMYNIISSNTSQYVKLSCASTVKNNFRFNRRTEHL